MSRLTIVIPSATFDSMVEDTLVSVLQNRPEYSEVIVVSATQYSDPYGLGREVRFLTCSESRELIDLINFGVEHARGDVVHLLLPGTQATDGWTDNVWEHFADERVAAVASVLLADASASRLHCAGVTYLSRGERRVVGAGCKLHDSRLGNSAVLGPILDAGFYRREVLLALRCFDRSYGLWLADVEFALALHDLGYRSVVDLNSHVISRRPIQKRPQSHLEAAQAERLFRRQSGTSNSSWTRTAWMMVEMLAGLPSFRAISCLSGRFAERRQASPRPDYEARLESARESLKNDSHEESNERASISIGSATRRRPTATATATRRAA